MYNDSTARSLWLDGGSAIWGEVERANQSGFNVAFSVCPRGAGRHGDKAHVVQANALWVDLDAEKFDASDPARGKELALAHLRRALPEASQPTILVDSGFGFHAYWPLNKPYAFDLDGAREHFENLLRRLAALLHGDESVADIARVMRLPGTYNFKIPEKPRLCHIIEFRSERCST